MEKCKYCATCFDGNEDMEFFAEAKTPVFLGCLYLRAGMNSKSEMEIAVSDESGEYGATFELRGIKYCPMCGRKLQV